MRFLIVVAFASVAFTGFNFVSTSEIAAPPVVEGKVDDYVLDLENEDEEGDIDLKDILSSTNERGLIASWAVLEQLEKMVQQMPCGWPEYGIPALAPYRRRRATFAFKSRILETLNKVFLLRVDGLDYIYVRKLKVNVFSKKFKFDFLFPKITISAARYETNTTVDALRELGVYVQFVGDGSFYFELHNLRIAGTMKGKIPIFFGSAKIVSLKTKVTLGKFVSDVTGLAENRKANRFFNRQIEKFVETAINSNTQKISDIIEQKTKDTVNPRLKGKDIWSLLEFILSGHDNEGDEVVSTCVPQDNIWDKTSLEN